MVAAPRLRTQAWRDLGAGGALIALWVAPWFGLTTATWVAGGHPSESLVAFINPGGVVDRLRAAHGAFEWWVLVAPKTAVVAWRFWASLALIAIAGTGASIGLRVTIARAGRGPLRTLSPPGRRMARSTHWARRGDLRSLRGHAGRDGVFLIGQHGRRLLTTQAETSVLVIGPTRSGKTAGLVIPNLLEWRGPVIATSTKSELVDVTAGHRQSIGPVYVYDPTGEVGRVPRWRA